MSKNNTHSLHRNCCNKMGHENVDCFIKQRDEENNTNISRNSRVQNPSGVRFVYGIRDELQQMQQNGGCISNQY